LKGDGIKSSNKTGLWWGAPDALKLVARLGQSATDANGAPVATRQWSAFVSHALAGGLQPGPILLARVKGQGVTPKTNLGLWATDSSGHLRELLRTGAVVTVAPGQSKTLAKMTLLNAPRCVFGTTRSFNATGSVVLNATFTDKSQALLRVEIP
jgi:hypothetical protein